MCEKCRSTGSQNHGVPICIIRLESDSSLIQVWLKYDSSLTPVWLKSDFKSDSKSISFKIRKHPASKSACMSRWEVMVEA